MVEEIFILRQKILGRRFVIIRANQPGQMRIARKLCFDQAHDIWWNCHICIEKEE
jgi:hypothetical protein